MTANVAILGASGYTGAELVRLIATHPSLRIRALTADRKAGQAMAQVGACKRAECVHNTDLECHAPAITVGW